MDIEKLKALALAATPGPWRIELTLHEHHIGGTPHEERRIFTEWDHPQLKGPLGVVNWSRGIPLVKGDEMIKFVSINEEDANYIAAACPATVLELIAEVERLRAEVSVINYGNPVDKSAPAAGTVEKDAERYRALHTLMQNAKGSASIEVNQHLAYYETAEPGQEVKLQWYPDTPIGFYTIEGATLDAVADEAVEYVRASTKAGKDSA